MTDQEMTMNTPTERPATGRVVEAEIRLPRKDEIHMPKIDLEPVRHMAEQALLTGIGISILAMRGASTVVRAAYKAGMDAAEQPGTVPNTLLNVMRAPGGSATRVGEIRKVPVLPIADYDDLAADEIIARLDALDREQLNTLRSYEVAHENRTPVLVAIDSQLSVE
jgi:hypothetical protein